MWRRGWRVVRETWRICTETQRTLKYRPETADRCGGDSYWPGQRSALENGQNNDIRGILNINLFYLFIIILL